MSINSAVGGITPAKVTHVQLADGWHEAQPGSFRVGTLWFGGPDQLGEMMGQGHTEGFTLATPAGDNISGPIASILAVRH